MTAHGRTLPDANAHRNSQTAHRAEDRRPLSRTPAISGAAVRRRIDPGHSPVCGHNCADRMCWLTKGT